MTQDVTYKQLGYTDYMEKSILGKSTRLSSLQIKTMFPMGSISFGQASGGTLTLGGDNNAGGIMSVLDSTGSEKVLINSDGITITDGKITIQDALGSTVLDSVGLVSENSFTFDSVEGSSSGSPISDNVGTFVDVTGLTLDFNLARTAHVLFLFQAGGFLAKDIDDPTSVSGQIGLILDDVEVGTTLQVEGFRHVAEWGADAQRGSDDMVWNQGFPQIVSAHYADSIASGDHTVKLQFRTSTDGYTFYVWKQYSRLSYLILGK